MERISEILYNFTDTVIFLICDNTSASDLTKEERIALMEENRLKEENARAQKEAKDKALRAAGDAYMETEEYIYAGEAEKIWIVVKYGIILDNRGELRFDEIKNQWIYTGGKSKVKIIITEHFAENGKTFSELLMSAFLFEAKHLKDKEEAETENTDEK